MMHQAYNSRSLFFMQYARLFTRISLYSLRIKRSIQLITAKLTKYSLSFSLNLYLRLIETKYTFLENFQKYFVSGLARHKYAMHIASPAYLRQRGVSKAQVRHAHCQPCILAPEGYFVSGLARHKYDMHIASPAYLRQRGEWFSKAQVRHAHCQPCILAPEGGLTNPVKLLTEYHCGRLVFRMPGTGKRVSYRQVKKALYKTSITITIYKDPLPF